MNADFILNLGHSQSICVKFNPQKWIPLEILIIFLFYTFKIWCLVQKLALKDFHWAPCSWDRAHGTMLMGQKGQKRPKSLKSKKLKFRAKIFEIFFLLPYHQVGSPGHLCRTFAWKKSKMSQKIHFKCPIFTKNEFWPIFDFERCHLIMLDISQIKFWWFYFFLDLKSDPRVKS